MSFQLYPLSGRFLLEPCEESGSCFSVFVSENKGVVIQREPRPSSSQLYGRVVHVHCLYGLFQLSRNSFYLGIVTRSDVTGIAPNGAEIRKVLAIDLLKIPNELPHHEMFTVPGEHTEEVENDDEQEHMFEDPILTPINPVDEMYLKYLRTALEQPSFYFSYGYDLTNSCQRIAESFEKDTRFYWNYSNLQEFFKEPSLKSYLVPIIHGLVKHDSNVEAGGITFSLLLISRRSRFNVGTRFNVRGLDDDGHAANFVETEQVLFSVHSPALTSFVQIRGSIPTKWDQHVTLKYAPRTAIISSEQERAKMFSKHFLGESNPLTYYNGRKVVCVNLIDRIGKSKSTLDQRALGEEYKKRVEEFKQLNLASTTTVATPQIDLIWFDFHYECRKMRWDRLSFLVDEIKDTLDNEIGFFAINSDGVIVRKQSGVVRTNCMDNLDRTNVAQCVIARRATVAGIVCLGGLLPEEKNPNVLNSPFPAFEAIFKGAWGDNADLISINYSGTPALKTDFTRTGKRTLAGLIQDGVNSVMRYYLNNFQDGRKQDALDLLHLQGFDPVVFADLNGGLPFLPLTNGKETFETIVTKLVMVYIVCYVAVSIVVDSPIIWATLIVIIGISFLSYRALKPGVSFTLAQKFLDETTLRQRMKMILKNQQQQ